MSTIYDQLYKLAEKLKWVAWGKSMLIFFLNSGSEATENSFYNSKAILCAQKGDHML